MTNLTTFEKVRDQFDTLVKLKLKNLKVSFIFPFYYSTCVTK